MTVVAAAPEPQLEPELDAQLDRYTCATCTYGVSVLRLPERCPMCGDGRWMPEPRRS